MGSVKTGEVGPLVLENDETWEAEMIFIPTVSGENQKVEFLLYKDSATEPPGESLHLLINVTD